MLLVVVVAAEKNENLGEDEVVVADDDAATAAAAAAAAGAAPAETASSDKNKGIDMPGAAGAESETAAPRDDLLRRFLPRKRGPLSALGGDGGRERGRTRRVVRGGCGRSEAAANGQGLAAVGVAPTETYGISSLRGWIIPPIKLAGRSLRCQEQAGPDRAKTASSAWFGCLGTEARVGVPLIGSLCKNTRKTGGLGIEVCVFDSMSYSVGT